MFIPPNLEPRTPAVRAGALSAGEEDVRRCARLRELDSDESEWTRVERNGCGVNSITGSGGCGFSRVVEEDEPVDDLVAVRLVVVLEPYTAVRIEVQVGQTALGHYEQGQTAQQDREIRSWAACGDSHGVIQVVHSACQHHGHFISRTLDSPTPEVCPEMTSKGQTTDKIRHQPESGPHASPYRKAWSLKLNSGGCSRCRARSGARGSSSLRDHDGRPAGPRQRSIRHVSCSPIRRSLFDVLSDRWRPRAVTRMRRPRAGKGPERCSRAARCPGENPFGFWVVSGPERSAWYAASC